MRLGQLSSGGKKCCRHCGCPWSKIIILFSYTHINAKAWGFLRKNWPYYDIISIIYFTCRGFNEVADWAYWSRRFLSQQHAALRKICMLFYCTYCLQCTRWIQFGGYKCISVMLSPPETLTSHTFLIVSELLSHSLTYLTLFNFQLI